MFVRQSLAPETGDLTFARQLHCLGRAVFPVPQDPDRGRDRWPAWRGYTLAGNAYRMTTERQPSDALATRLGGPLSLWEADPRSNPQAVAELDALLDQVGAKVVAEAVSGGGGLHRYVRKGPEPLPTRLRLRPGVDVLGDASVAFIPGGATRAKHAKPYELIWSDIPHTDWARPVDDRAIRELLAKPEKGERPQPRMVTRDGALDLTRTRVRNPRAYGEGAIRKAPRDILELTAGGRHRAIARVAYDLGGTLVALGFGEADLLRAEHALADAARRVGKDGLEDVVFAFRDGCSTPYLPPHLLLA